MCVGGGSQLWLLKLNEGAAAEDNLRREAARLGLTDGGQLYFTGSADVADHVAYKVADAAHGVPVSRRIRLQHLVSPSYKVSAWRITWPRRRLLGEGAAGGTSPGQDERPGSRMCGRRRMRRCGGAGVSPKPETRRPPWCAGAAAR